MVKRRIKRTITILIVMIVVLANVFVVSGAAATYADDTPRTPSGIPLSELEQFLDNHMAGYVGDSIAGAAIIIMQNGEVFLNRSYGYANTATGVLVDEDTVFDWASVTKLITWVSVMQLVEQGYLDLNTDIREYLPDDFLSRLQFDTPITMYNLMHHNVGWGMREIGLMTNSPANIVSLGEALRRAEPNQMYEPGTVVAYSNFGVALAGYIVERVSGLPFHEYVNRNIFAVLDMNDTAIHPYQADNPPISDRRDRLQGYMPNMFPALFNRVFFMVYPTGSAMGTANDMAKFLAALTPPQGERSPLFNNESTLQEMLTISYSFGDNIPGMAHGFFEEFFGVRTLGHAGSLVQLSSSRLMFSTECGFGLVMMTNTDNLDFGPGLARALFGEYVPEVYTGSLPNIRNLNNLTGWYSPGMRLENRGFMQLIGNIPMPSDRINIIDDNTLGFRGMEFTQIAPFAFWDESTGFMLHLIVENNNVTRVLLMADAAALITAGMVLEYIPRTGINVFGTYLSLILLVICLFLLIAFGIIRATRKASKARKNRKKGLEVIPLSTVEKQTRWLGLAALAVVINFLVIMIRARVFNALHSALMPHFAINIAFMLFAPAFSGFILWKMSKAGLPKKSKIFCMLTCVASIVFAVLVLVWEFYR